MSDGVVGNIKEWIKQTEQARGEISTVLNLVNIDNFKQTDNFYVQYFNKVGTVTGSITSNVNILTGFCRCDNASAVSYTRCKQIFDSYGIHSYYTQPYDGTSKEFNLPFSNYDYRITTNSSNISSMTYSPNNFRGVDGISSFSVSNMTDGYNGLTKKGNIPYNVAFLKSGNWLGCAFFQLGVHNDTNFIDCSYYFVELNDELVSALGTSNIIERYDPNDPNFGMGGVAQGLQGIIDTLSDDINVPLKSTKGATTTGFINAYVIEQDELKDFGKDMFTDIDLDFTFDPQTTAQSINNAYTEAGFDFGEDFGKVMATGVQVSNSIGNVFELLKASVKNFFTSKLINYVLSVHLIPVNPSTLASAERIDVGWKKFEQTAKRITNDYVDFDYGTLTIPSKYKNFLDYTHTHCKIFIPFTGFVDIDPRYVYDQTLGLKVRFNVLDGTCVTFLTTTGLNGSTSVIGTYSGSCCVHLPFTGENYSQIASGLLQTATSVGGALAMGNFAVGMASAMQPSMQNVAPPTQHMTKATKKNPNPIFYTTQDDIANYNTRLANAQSQYNNDLQARESNIANAKFGRNLKTSNALIGNLGSTGNALNGSAMGSANMSSSSAFMGIRTPYIIIERPIPQLPPRYFDDHGALANIVEKPINCKGYTRCSDVVMPATIKSDIALKLKEIMESGFIV